MALAMLDQSKYEIQRKMVNHQPDDMITELIVISAADMDYYKTVPIYLDIMHVNKVPFLVIVSQHIYYSTVCAVESIKMPVLENEISRIIIKIYCLHVFNIKYDLVDIQFKHLRIKDQGLLPIVVNVVTKGEHVPEIEPFIW